MELETLLIENKLTVEPSRNPDAGAWQSFRSEFASVGGYYSGDVFYGATPTEAAQLAADALAAQS